MQPSVAHRRGRWRRNWVYWSRGADVYPDGHVNEWTQEHTAHGDVSIEPVESGRLVSPDYIWDGHTQGHCGEHIYISGRDKALVDEAFQRRLTAVLARQDGVCHSRLHAHDRAADGREVYEVDFSTVRRKGSSETLVLSCSGHYDHEWGDWSEWREVAPGSENRQRICNRCICLEIAARFTMLPAPAPPAG